MKYVLIALLAATALHAADDENLTWDHVNGRAWVQMFGSAAERTKAQETACGLYLIGVLDGWTYTDGAKADKELPQNMEYEQLIAYIDLFFAEPANRIIPVAFVLRFARFREDGTIRDGAVDAAIAAARRTFSKPPPTTPSRKPPVRL